MKSVDLQISVRRSQDATRSFSTKDRAAETAVKTMSASFSKDLKERQVRVTAKDRAFNSRIENRDSPKKRHGSEGKGSERHKNDEKPSADPQKGRIVDTTAGFLA